MRMEGDLIRICICEVCTFNLKYLNVSFFINWVRKKQKLNTQAKRSNSSDLRVFSLYKVKKKNPKEKKSKKSRQYHHNGIMVGDIVLNILPGLACFVEVKIYRSQYERA